MIKNYSRVLLLFSILSCNILLQAESASMNFQNVDIRAVIAAVSESTGKNFIIDPRVNGSVTLISSSDVEPDVLYDIFLSILKVHGYVAIPDADNHVVKIVPAFQTKTEAELSTSSSDIADNEVTLRVIQVHNASATEMIPILRPLVSKEGHLAAHQSSNIIIVSDTQQNVDKLETLIKKMDGVKESAIKTVELRYANAIDAAKTLNAVMKVSGAGKSTLQIVGVERTNSVMINGSDTDIAKVEGLLDSLDIQGADQSGTAVIKLNFADAKNIANILDKMVSAKTGNTGGGVTAAETQSSSPLTTSKATGSAATQVLGSLASSRTQFDQTPVQISVDEKANSVIIIGSPKSVENLRRIVQRLDVKRSQVMVEVLIVEMSADKSKQLGIQWGGVTTDLTAPTLTSSLGAIIGTIKTGGILNFSVLAEALATDADANLISAPSLLTLENEEAEITVGREVPFVTGSFTSTGNGSNPDNPFTTIERNNVGLTLKITPQINKGDVIKLKIDQEFSNILPNAQSNIGAVDVVTSKRTIKTNVLVKDKQMLVLGGLIDDSVQETQNRAPGISNVPLIGRFFKSRSTSKEKRNLMIFIQPHIVRNDQTGEQLTADRYNYMRDLQVQREKRGVSLLPKEKQPVLDNVYGQPQAYAENPSEKQTSKLKEADLFDSTDRIFDDD